MNWVKTTHDVKGVQMHFHQFIRIIDFNFRNYSRTKQLFSHHLELIATRFRPLSPVSYSLLPTLNLSLIEIHEKKIHGHGSGRLGPTN